MGNKVSFGLTNVYYSKITTNNDVDVYGEPIRLYGAQELSSEVMVEVKGYMQMMLSLQH